ncbi:MAG: tetratricopeptide repeat protein [Verrucomicrobiales bacterium]
MIFHDFVLHDDPHEIYANPILNPLTPESWKQIWSRPDFSFIYIPVNYSALALVSLASRTLDEVGSGGVPSPMFFHVLGLVLHTVNSLLVMQLIHLMARTVGGERRDGFITKWGSILGALLFALHPVQVESFARAGNVTVTLGVFFALTALLVEFRAVIRSSNWLGFTSTLLFVLGLLTRPSVVVWPVISAVLLLAAFPQRARFIGGWFVPRAILALGYVLLTLRLQQGVPDIQHLDVAWWQRPLIAADSLYWYTAQVLLPLKLSIDHGRTPDVILNSKLYWIGLLALGAVAYVLWKLLVSRHRLAVVGICIFALSVLPVTGLLPAPAREHFSVVYDRHLYFAMFGVALAAVAGLKVLRAEWRLPVAMVVITSAAWLSFSNVQHWKNSISLFEHVVRINSRSWYGHGMLATALTQAGRAREAIPHFLESIKLNPAMTEARVNLGQALLEAGQWDDAEAVLIEAARLRPLDPNAHNNLAVAAIQTGKWDLAEGAAGEALRLKPPSGEAWNNFGVILAAKKEFGKALEAHRRAMELLPHWPTARFAYGKTLLASGAREQGLREMATASAMAPAHVHWQRELASELQKGTPKEADEKPVQNREAAKPDEKEEKQPR